MSVIKKALMDCIINQFTIHEKVLRYTNKSKNNKIRRIIGTTNKLINVL